MSHETLQTLMERKDHLEASIEQHGMVLKANNIGLYEPLVDSDGHPRHDIDVYAVRKARHSIICLQNDRKALLATIEKEMALLFKQGQNTVSSSVPDQQTPPPMEVDDGGEANVTKRDKPLEPFVLVERVEPGQLADRMGIAIQDKILQIGTLSALNFKTLNQIQTMIHNARGGKLLFVVRKANTGKDVTIEMDLSAEGTRMGFFLKPLKG
ncbi:26S proteasome non-ATPase regulatory subunit 9 [Anopheles marshallii]|uniref:26S proteasome non-ATPase regulatory subunit 9 n=1 Tax=Anopheles marshallii TaxID=1521116 RepID=UPI00237B6393|nr:26S proteasome non-ATPase regulatory subunit 9 [Anopheles marshallii]